MSEASPADRNDVTYCLRCYHGAYGQQMGNVFTPVCTSGTLVVWDVDVLSAGVIKSYTASAPDHPVVFRRQDMAHAEPAVPGWQMMEIRGIMPHQVVPLEVRP
jgi:hypothetical protein